MSTNNDRQNTHDMIDHIFHDLLPAQGMAERPEQTALSHRMLDALLDGSIALCDAGTGIGKTYAYLAAGAAFLRFRATNGQKFRPIIISTTSIAHQNAVQTEYLPVLSAAMMADGIIDQPLCTVIRKGKSHYVCVRRLEQRLGQLDLSRKNWKAGRALLSLRKQLDMDTAAHLSNYDRDRVCVPQTCDCCGQKDCRYLAFLEDCDSGDFPFQICNHNLLLADAIHRGIGRSPILPDACAVIIDEAHKLPDAARQMFGTTLDAQDIRSLIRSLSRERFQLASESLSELSAPLLRLMDQPFDTEKSFINFSRLLIAPSRNLHIIQKQLHGLLSSSTHHQLKKLSSTMELFTGERTDLVYHTMEDRRGGTILCAVAADMTAQLRATLWSHDRSVILTSGTLAVGTDFRRFKEESGLLADGRVTESVSASPFDYKAN